ncbi:NAD-dependent epimerase/dehydratase family protein [Gynuella sunshinyii]|uniref:Nucleoside-diphosphate-sugar epimerase n=1 Tax=Gynuella sunshinyii YC6258 TaxID=1445510 RepID=A0A0C5VU59_9GAMM|nr:NAD(P)-dependent oxidoreductase [Gynuella sunshinyii]AJQ97696.1 nucleoside-diphosphate-sugar epimerase [Gynuella sunshinyii YC6258]
MTKILVTGASGFVGSTFMQRFAAHDDLELFGVARRAMPWSNYAQVDLAQGLNIDFKPDVVVHAAAHVSPWGTEQEYHRKNVTATQEVIRFCEQNECPRLIYLSSSSVFYRDEPQFNITEDSPIGPEFISWYAASKYAGEQLVSNYQGEHVILRPRAVFGPGDTVLFPRILRAAQKNRLALLTGEGQPAVGDFIYIETLCDYILTAAVKPGLHGAYNLTNAETVEFQSLLLTILDRLGLPRPTRRLKVTTAMRIAGWLERLYRVLHLSGEPPVTRYSISVFAHSKTFDPSRMLRDLGPPSISLSEGIDRFVTWQRQHA